MKNKHSKSSHTKHTHVYDWPITKIIGVARKRANNLIHAKVDRSVEVRVGEVIATIGNYEYINKISKLPSYSASFKVDEIAKDNDNLYLPKVNFSSEEFSQAMVSATKDLDIKVAPQKV